MIGRPRLSPILTIVIIANRMAAGDQSGCTTRSSTAVLTTCGQAIDVPDSILKLDRLKSERDPVIGIFGTKGANIFTPRAIISGLRISETIGLGPLVEKATSIGVLSIPRLY
ncbi:hypothetical protein U1Q18_052496 [Sarracenia purpurea var. burkii]